MDPLGIVIIVVAACALVAVVIALGRNLSRYMKQWEQDCRARERDIRDRKAEIERRARSRL